MKPNAPTFERLKQAVTMIARHADYPGKLGAVAECMDEIEDYWRRGRLTLEQRFRLIALLVRGRSHRGGIRGWRQRSEGKGRALDRADYNRDQHGRTHRPAHW
jgi:hypothetical protein